MRFAEILLEHQPTPFWRILRQIGVEDAVGVLPRSLLVELDNRADLPWDYYPLAFYADAVEAEGLRLTVLEDGPPLDATRRGGPGREEEIEHVCRLIRNMGRLGIGVWCYNWMAGFSWVRTSFSTQGRGGALTSAFELAAADAAGTTRLGDIEEQVLWDNLAYFLARVLPVAEEAGVCLAMHPDDPPLAQLRGVSRIMSSVSAFERLLELVPSDANGLTLCQGNFTLMTDDVPAAIRLFGEQRKVFFVHFRDVNGTASSFVETFHDEGQTDMLACMRAYRDVGFHGVMRTDHVPNLEGDSAATAGYSTLGRLFAIGYMTGLREAVLAETRV